MINGNTFLELFKIQVSARGNKPALNDPTAGRQMTYAELDEYAGRVAAKMRENGVAHGDNVALVMPNSLHEAAAILAAMKLGAAVAPLNPLYPRTGWRISIRTAPQSSLSRRISLRMRKPMRPSGKKRRFPVMTSPCWCIPPALRASPRAW